MNNQVIKRRNHSSDVASITDVFDIDLADKAELQNQLISVMPQCNLVGVTIETIGCTGISGNFVLKQSMSKNTPRYDFPEGALTIAAAATAENAFDKATLTMECVQIQLPATLPSAGKIRVTVCGKR